VGAPGELTQAELAAVSDPAALLDRAWALEPWGRYAEREAALARLETLLGSGLAPPSPAGRDWHLELLAERAVDVGRSRRLDEAFELVQEVVSGADPAHEIALARAMLASGQAWAWVGTDEATRESNRAFAEAAERFAALGNRDWQGSALLRRGYSGCYQHGDVALGETLIRQALETYPPGSDRLPGALASYADVLIDLGRFDDAEAALDSAAALAEGDGFEKARGDVAWCRARVAAGRGDARSTERLLVEAVRATSSMDWFGTHIGTSFLLECAELLDLLGVGGEAQRYLEAARERAGDEDEEVLQTQAVIRARTGDPRRALDELQRLVRGEWLEKRVVWRHTLLTAWATFRAGREGAGALTARALEQAIACGSVEIARAGEPLLVSALAPMAERAGSDTARRLMLGGRELVVRLFGTAAVTDAEGHPLELPPGMPGELVRMLAIQEHGLLVDVVLEALFPDAPANAARQRLRQVLTRLRAAAGEIVVREEGRLRLVPAWIDVREFLVASNRVRGANGARSVQLAYAALALHAGELLPEDIYAEWAQDIRGEVRYRHLELLDLVAADAAARGSHDEALTALEAAAREDPNEPDRDVAIAEHLQALGRNQAAAHVAKRASLNRAS